MPLTQSQTECQQEILKTFSNTTTLIKQYFLSGKYFNELGEYTECQYESTGFNYALALVHNQSYYVYDLKYVWGFCISDKCGKSSLKALDQFLRTSASLDGLDISNGQIEYLLPKDDLEANNESRKPVLWTLVSIMCLSFILGILGIFVEYTTLGTAKLSHEQTNFANIDIPLIQEGSTKDQLKQLMMIKDELLRNSKRLWASIVLCFSFTRNLRHLFYKYKIQSEKVLHRNSMYFIAFLGLSWFILFTATQIGIISFPKNIFIISQELKQAMFVLNHGGQLFGLNMMFFAAGYILAVNFLNNYSTFIPKDFHSTTSIKTREGSQSFMSNKDAQATMEQVDLGGGDDNKYYIKRKQFVFIVCFFRKFFRIFIPMLFATLGILYILPFISSGPLYLVALRNQFLIPCEYGWFLNLTFIQNLLYWDNTYSTSSCYPYVSNGMLSSSSSTSSSGSTVSSTTDDQKSVTDKTNSQCQHACGMYLQMFACLLQLFLISPFILYLHKYFRKISYALIVVLIAFNMAVTFALVYDFKIQAYMFFDTQYLTYLLHRPWFRFPSFFTGLLFGLIVARIHAQRMEIKYDLVMRVILYICGLAICLISIFLLKFNNDCYDDLGSQLVQQGCFSTVGSALYTAIAPQAFNFGLILILTPSVTDTNPIVNEQMGLRVLFMYDGWRIMYKLSVTAYICHYLVIFWYYSSINSSGLHFSKWMIARITYGSLIMSYFLGFIFFLLIDKPIRNIDKLVLFPTKISDSFLVKKSRGAKNSGGRKDKVAFADKNDIIEGGPKNKNDDAAAEESAVSDESEDEDTTTYRRAKVMENESYYVRRDLAMDKDIFMSYQMSNESNNELVGTITSNDEKYYNNAINKTLTESQVQSFVSNDQSQNLKPAKGLLKKSNISKGGEGAHDSGNIDNFQYY